MMENSDSRRVRFSEAKLESPARTPARGVENYGSLSDQKRKLESELVFNTSKEACTPTINRVLYVDPKDRDSVSVAPPSSISRPNYEDILRRVSVVIHQHISKCESNLSTMSLEAAASDSGLLRASKIKIFSEENFTSPQYVYHFVRAPVCRIGFLYGIRKVNKQWNTPSLSEVYTFLWDLFVEARLSAECSIVCLIYVERLMENASVPLVATTWRPILLCGLLLASKVWQDLRYDYVYIYSL
mmetsp:Transcript_12768/g.12416  ORF Transcript_12768/g.12416 Transcript_12768/m.12416 type:complete len:243 (-) Transcript_12768:97-825(-)